MTPERWQEIKEILHAAMQVEPTQRSAYLDRACSSDPSLRQEVESLLVANEKVRSSFLESPPLQGESFGKGTKLGPYEIVSSIGAGGMGLVFLAEDTRLGRKVALKLLRPETLADPAGKGRFLREARAVAALNHPNIAVLYDVGESDGQPFLAMEFVEGKSLREVTAQGPLPSNRIVEYAVQIACGLEHAHSRGILHRDIKTGNIILTSGGILKLLDFGLAKMTERGEETLSAPGTWLGTLHYCPPEILSGSEATPRSDLYSLGVVLYEMACGQLPLAGLDSAALVSAILRGSAPPVRQRNPAVSSALSRVIERAMAARPEDRFPTAAELRAALQTSVRGIPEESPSAQCVLAILQFQNISGNPSIDWFSTGIAETLHADLKKLQLVRVVSRERVHEQLRRNGGRDTRPDEVGRQLGADWVVEGSYQRAGDRLRITTRLLEVGTGDVIATGKVDGLWDDVFALEDRVVSDLMSAMKIQLDSTALNRIASPETRHLKAYEHYAQGRKVFVEFGKDSLEQARQEFEAAISLDPLYAMAHSGLGATYAMRFIHRTDPDDLSRARGHLERARELDPELAEPYPWLCFLYMRDRKLREALDAGQRAIQLQPDHVQAHYFLGLAYFVSCEIDPNNYQSAANHLLEAARIEPRWQPTWFVLAFLSLLNGNYERAEEFAHRLLQFSSEESSTGRFIGAEMMLGTVFLRRGNSEAARAWYTRSLDVLSRLDHMYRDAMNSLSACGLGDVRLREGKPDLALADYRRAWRIVQEYPRMMGRDRVATRTLAGLASAYAARGEGLRARELLLEAVQILEKAQPQSAAAGASLPDTYYAVAVAHVRTKDINAALHMLEKAVQTGWRDPWWFERDSEMHPLRDEPRFLDLVQQVSHSAKVKIPDVTVMYAKTVVHSSAVAEEE